MFMTAVGGGAGRAKNNIARAIQTHSGVQNLDNGCICTKSVILVGELEKVLGKHLAIVLGRKIVHDDPFS